MRDVPLLRYCSEANGVDPTKIWTYYYLHGLLKKTRKESWAVILLVWSLLEWT